MIGLLSSKHYPSPINTRFVIGLVFVLGVAFFSLRWVWRTMKTLNYLNKNDAVAVITHVKDSLLAFRFNMAGNFLSLVAGIVSVAKDILLSIYNGVWNKGGVVAILSAFTNPLAFYRMAGRIVGLFVTRYVATNLQREESSFQNDDMMDAWMATFCSLLAVISSVCFYVHFVGFCEDLFLLWGGSRKAEKSAHIGAVGKCIRTLHGTVWKYIGYGIVEGDEFDGDEFDDHDMRY